MASNLFEELAEHEIPPVPTDFNAVVHQKVNRSLLTLQMFDLLWRGLPLAFVHFARGMVGLLVYTLTGKFPVEKKTGPERS